MTKAELLLALAKMPDDAVVTIVDSRGHVHDVAYVNWARATPGWLKQSEIYIRSTEGRV